MKKIGVILLSVILLTGCNRTDNKSANLRHADLKKSSEASPLLLSDTLFTFNNYPVGKIPAGWSQYFTGKGKKTDWQVTADNGNNVLAQLSEQDMGGHFNEIVFDGFTLKNVALKVKIKGVRGKRDQGGGFVWRFIDADNHYIVRANPLEDNVVLYKMENGKRTDLPLLGKGRTYGVDVAPLGNNWNNLKLTVVGDLFTVYLNNKEIFQVKDQTFTEAGKVGLWTKADAVSYFDDFEVIPMSE